MYVILALILRANETNDVYNPNALVRLTDFYNLTDIYNILQGTQYQDFWFGPMVKGFTMTSANVELIESTAWIQRAFVIGWHSLVLWRQLRWHLLTHRVDFPTLPDRTTCWRASQQTPQHRNVVAGHRVM